MTFLTKFEPNTYLEQIYFAQKKRRFPEKIMNLNFFSLLSGQNLGKKSGNKLWH